MGEAPSEQCKNHHKSNSVHTHGVHIATTCQRVRRSSPLQLDPQASPDGALRLPAYLTTHCITLVTLHRPSTQLTASEGHAGRLAGFAPPFSE